MAERLLYEIVCSFCKALFLSVYEFQTECTNRGNESANTSKCLFARLIVTHFDCHCCHFYLSCYLRPFPIQTYTQKLTFRCNAPSICSTQQHRKYTQTHKQTSGTVLVSIEGGKIKHGKTQAHSQSISSKCACVRLYLQPR